MRAQTILFLSVDGVKEKLDCRPYRGHGEGNPKKLVEAASRAFPTLSIILTIRSCTSSQNIAFLTVSTQISLAALFLRHSPVRAAHYVPLALTFTLLAMLLSVSSASFFSSSVSCSRPAISCCSSSSA